MSASSREGGVTDPPTGCAREGVHKTLTLQGAISLIFPSSFRGPQMGGQIRRGWIWRFWGAPIFSPEVPNTYF